MRHVTIELTDAQEALLLEGLDSPVVQGSLDQIFDDIRREVGLTR